MLGRIIRSIVITARFKGKWNRNIDQHTATTSKYKIPLWQTQTPILNIHQEYEMWANDVKNLTLRKPRLLRSLTITEWVFSVTTRRSWELFLKSRLYSFQIVSPAPASSPCLEIDNFPSMGSTVFLYPPSSYHPHNRHQVVANSFNEFIPNSADWDRGVDSSSIQI